MRRRGQNHHVHAAIDRLLVGVKAHKPPCGRHVDAVANAVDPPEIFEAVLDPVGEHVGHGHQFTGPAVLSAWATAPPPRPPHPMKARRSIAAAGMGHSGDAQAAGGGNCGHAPRLEELPRKQPSEPRRSMAHSWIVSLVVRLLVSLVVRSAGSRYRIVAHPSNIGNLTLSPMTLSLEPGNGRWRMGVGMFSRRASRRVGTSKNSAGEPAG